MPNKETSPLGDIKMTTQLNEGTVTPVETILNGVISQYLYQRKQERNPLSGSITTEDVNFILSKYCDEHPGLSADKKRDLHTTIQTLLELRLNRGQ